MTNKRGVVKPRKRAVKMRVELAPYHTIQDAIEEGVSAALEPLFKRTTLPGESVIRAFAPYVITCHVYGTLHDFGIRDGFRTLLKHVGYGVDHGVNRAHKHVDHPDRDGYQREIENAVGNEVWDNVIKVPE